MNPFTRRAFLARAVAGAGASYVLASVPQLAEAHAYAAKQATSDSRSFHYFTPEQSSEVSAICEQILPSGDGPGAREAGVIFFIDYALSKFEMENRAAYVAGLEQLQLAAQKKEPAKKFSQLSSEQQIEVLKSIEKSDFFKLVRQHTLIGFLGDPRNGGNKDQVGWRFIGFDDAQMFQPPFGYYDEEFLKGKG